MGYRRVNAELFWAILVQMRNGESNRQIRRVLWLDKKTVNRYAAKITELAVPTGLSYSILLVSLLSEPFVRCSCIAEASSIVLDYFYILTIHTGIITK